MKKNMEFGDEDLTFFTPDALVVFLGIDFRYETFFHHGRRFPSRVLTPSNFPDFHLLGWGKAHLGSAKAHLVSAQAHLCSTLAHLGLAQKQVQMEKG